MRTAIVSTYPPRACGIGTFSADLRATLPGTGTVTVADLVAIVHEPSSPQRRGLLATIAQAVRGDYVRTARMLGRLDVDVVLLQHEYGIFGGRDGEYVLSFAQELAQPLVVTLHTVLSEPTPHQAEVLTELCAEAELVIVMTDTALRLLVESGACPEEKVRVVPHGAPVRIAERAARNLQAPRSTSSTEDCTFPALHVRPDLARQGSGDGDRSAAGDDRTAPGDRLHDRRPHPSGCLASGGGAVSADAGAARGRARARGPCRVRRSVPVDRRALGPARVDRRLPDAVREPGADRLRRAHLRNRCGLRCRLHALLVCTGHARFGRGAARSVPRLGSSRPCGLQLRRAAGHAEGGARRGTADRFDACVAGRRRGHCGRLAGSRHARAAATARRRRRPAPDELAYRPSAHTRRRRRHRAARARNHSQPQQRLLRRRCRSAGRRLARTCTARRGADLDLESLPRARLPSGSCRGRRDAQLHGLRPSLARRAACRRPRGTLDLGARRHPGHRVDPRRRAAGAGSPRPARRHARRRRFPAHGRICGARPLPPRHGPARDGRAPAARTARRATRSCLRAHLPRRTGAGSRTSSATTTPGCRRRSSSAAAHSAGRSSPRWVSNRCAGSATSADSTRTRSGSRVTAAAAEASRRRAPATSSRSKPPRSSKPS